MMAAAQPDFRARYEQASRAFRVASPSPLARIGFVVLTIAALGLLVILGVFSLVIGGVVIALGALVFAVQMLIAKIRGGRTLQDKRENVRVIRRDIE